MELFHRRCCCLPPHTATMVRATGAGGFSPAQPTHELIGFPLALRRAEASLRQHGCGVVKPLWGRYVRRIRDDL